MLFFHLQLTLLFICITNHVFVFIFAWLFFIPVVLDFTLSPTGMDEIWSLFIKGIVHPKKLFTNLYDWLTWDLLKNSWRMLVIKQFWFPLNLHCMDKSIVEVNRNWNFGLIINILSSIWLPIWHFHRFTFFSQQILSWDEMGNNK